MVEACDRCGTEFMVGARFCHICGTVRQPQTGPLYPPSWTRHLEFQNIMHGLANITNGLGLSKASLIAFAVGAAAILGAVVVGFYSVQNLNDFWAVQLYRIQWLLAAVAASVAGILLKKTPSTKN